MYFSENNGRGPFFAERERERERESGENFIFKTVFLCEPCNALTFNATKCIKVYFVLCVDTKPYYCMLILAAGRSKSLGVKFGQHKVKNLYFLDNGQNSRYGK